MNGASELLTTIVLSSGTATTTVCAPLPQRRPFIVPDAVISVGGPLPTVDDKLAVSLSVHISFDLPVAPEEIHPGLYGEMKRRIYADTANGLFFALRSNKILGAREMYAIWESLRACVEGELVTLDDLPITPDEIRDKKEWAFEKAIRDCDDSLGPLRLSENLAAAVLGKHGELLRQRCQFLAKRLLAIADYLDASPQRRIPSALRIGALNAHSDDAKTLRASAFAPEPGPGERAETSILREIEACLGESPRSAKRHRQALKKNLAP